MLATHESDGDAPPEADAFERIVTCLAGRRVVALTGAGCSTESGIPDYRSPGRVARAPIQHDAFMRKPDVRQRYWARATAAWTRFAGAQPNQAHHALADLERAGVVTGVITQNVDRLHHAAGSSRVVELHGALADVRCLACGRTEERASVHARLLARNPAWLDAVAALAPDGDADLPPEAVASFRTVGCTACGGDLKPDVVFFGGTVAAPVVESAWSLLDQADVMLVAGSSLTVYSGYRFVRGARERGMPVAIINWGPTRADPLVDLRWQSRLGEALPRLAARLLGNPAGID